MNANSIINDDMTLEEKLAAIDAAMSNMQGQNQKSQNHDAPEGDPSEALICVGCQ